MSINDDMDQLRADYQAALKSKGIDNLANAEEIDRLTKALEDISMCHPLIGAEACIKIAISALNKRNPKG